MSRCLYHQRCCREPDEPFIERTKVVYPEVVKDLLERVEMGRKKYGVPLTTNNGRKALQDAYEEALDLAMYLKQRIMEDE